MTGSSNEIPPTMKRLVVTSPGEDVASCKIEVQEVPVPKPACGEVLIKVAAAAINPSDYGTWFRCKPEQCPFAMGNEGSGTIVSSGGGLSTLTCRIGAKVGFVGLKHKQGAYSEYVVVSTLEGVFSLPDDLPVEDAASFFVNPYTAIGILDTVKSEGNSAFVHTAAASQLGQMIVKLAPTEGVEVINIVRREEQAELLRGIGAKHVVVSGSDNSWKEELRLKIKEMGTTIAFDAVAGSLTGDLLDILPKKGTVYVYGVLAGKVENVSPMDLIYRQKKINGFHLSSWLRSGGHLKTVLRLSAAGKKVNSGLKPGGWSSSTFKDTTLENAHADIVELLGSSATGQKLRLRFD
mmetsp:Transcript_18625/g.25648  ORF Transcript_18625/g.25648 Transcript_18625/m.25648 type:complete len:350 (-) Transcript_18625:418-1467(-)|eukprot:CAMPEP_0185731270 /NCGR_PEP_ID=MMETSP1171-20130828/12393_1 /TAXON_ID=374046 /ORGANISM="Helicotheca tamensis, Strain CCMP826" /LENGTH=349 /DNA_ID=CAMNT_0028400501 /DNA_START=121 /DNA_END=1170 /DNA_ORIENTATION=+